jgi:hypothetical protein
VGERERRDRERTGKGRERKGAGERRSVEGREEDTETDVKEMKGPDNLSVVTARKDWYVICGAHCQMKRRVLCLRIIKNFKIPTVEFRALCN